MDHSLSEQELREAIDATKVILNEASKGSLNDFWVVIDCDSENFRDYMHRSNTQGLINIVCKNHKALCTRKKLDNVALFASGDKDKAEKEAKRRAKLMKIELVSEAAACKKCERMRDAHKSRAAKHRQAAKNAKDPKQQQGSMNRAKASDNEAVSAKCRDCSKQVDENYYNPRNVVAKDQTTGASTDDTVYADIKAKRPYQTGENDAMDTERDQKVVVPRSIIALLTSRSNDAKAYSEKLHTTQIEDKQFYLDLAQAFDDLNDYLKSGTVYDIKMASVFLTSLMGPMLYEVPTEVVRFITYGGEHTPLKSFMNSITTPNGGFDIAGKTYRSKK